MIIALVIMRLGILNCVHLHRLTGECSLKVGSLAFLAFQKEQLAMCMWNRLRQEMQVMSFMNS